MLKVTKRNIAIVKTLFADVHVGRLFVICDDVLIKHTKTLAFRFSTGRNERIASDMEVRLVKEVNIIDNNY